MHPEERGIQPCHGPLDFCVRRVHFLRLGFSAVAIHLRKCISSALNENEIANFTMDEDQSCHDCDRCATYATPLIRRSGGDSSSCVSTATGGCCRKKCQRLKSKETKRDAIDLAANSVFLCWMREIAL
ncbi:hypothetical protein ACLKA6_008694, partial [Drosophila palustris]